MNKIRQAHSKIKFSMFLVVAVSIAAGFSLSHFVDPFSDTTETHKRIGKLFKTHGLLQRCNSGSRELDFLEKGGEYFADYEKPRTLNDKIGYVLHNYFLKSPVTMHIGNKYLAKKYIARVVGKDYVTKLLGVWDSPRNIEWNTLPDRFVLKAVRGHYGKQVIIIKDKNKTDVAEIIGKLEEFCKTPGMQEVTRKRILAEEYLEPPGGVGAITDYKFFCSHGKALFAYCLAVGDEDTCDMDKKSFSF